MFSSRTDTRWQVGYAVHPYETLLLERLLRQSEAAAGGQTQAQRDCVLVRLNSSFWGLNPILFKLSIDSQVVVISIKFPGLVAKWTSCYGSLGPLQLFVGVGLSVYSDLIFAAIDAVSALMLAHERVGRQAQHASAWELGWRILTVATMSVCELYALPWVVSAGFLPEIIQQFRIRHHVPQKNI